MRKVSVQFVSVLLIVLQSQFGKTFDRFMPSRDMFVTKASLSAIMARGVSEKCNRTFNNLDQDERWQYFDSWGKPSSGILSGHVKWFGAFDQCLAIPHSRYCLTTIVGKFRTNMTVPILWGICVPDACAENDIANGLDNFVKNVSHRLFPTLRVFDLSCYEEQSYTAGVVLTIIFCGIILLLCAIGTAIEVCQETLRTDQEYVHLPKQNDVLKLYKEQDESSFGSELPKVAEATETTPLIRPNKRQNGLVDSVRLKTGQENDTKHFSEDKVDEKPSSMLVELLLCFSIVRNSREVMRTDVSPGAVTSLYGMRVISMFWITLCHVYVFARSPIGFVENLRDLLEQTENFSMMVVSNGYPAVDTFFFLSGLLLMYNVMKRLNNNNGEIHWGKFYVHRFLRLTPTLMFVILFIVQLEPFLDRGPLWQRHVEKENCGEYWWTNLLYINNFYPTNAAKNGCLTWGWYLAVDMQFFLITPVIIYLFYRYGYRGVIGTSVSLGTVAVICTAVITNHYDIHPMSESLLKSTTKNRMDIFNYIYIKPYCRIHPYLVGLVLGYLMHRKLFRAKQLGWPLSTVFWFTALIVGLSLIYGPFTAMREDPRPWTMSEKILYATTRNLVWAILLAWVTYACEYGYGGYVQEFLSARFWIPLGRLTYSTYLVHCQLIKIMYVGYRSAIMFSTQWWVYIYCAALVLSHGIAFILALTVEYPCANLEKLLFRATKDRKDQK